ncbi:MAG: hypothetical protein M9899_02890 [Bdellovibrionaceae bacterium]|nr:hypothetical protein [Pseudobdellovibrionaceae bacterium]
MAQAHGVEAQVSGASKSQKNTEIPNSKNRIALYFDVQGEQAFVLKERTIKNKPEYFLSFVRGKQTYGSVLISKKQYEQYKKALDKNFLVSKSKKRGTASEDACHQQMAYQRSSELSPKPVCWSHLSAASQKNLRGLVSGMNKKLYGVTRHDLL